VFLVLRKLTKVSPIWPRVYFSFYPHKKAWIRSFEFQALQILYHLLIHPITRSQPAYAEASADKHSAEPTSLGAFYIPKPVGELIQTIKDLDKKFVVILNS